MARRRNWSDLDASYRRRLERNGITRKAYESGVSLQAARGQAAERARAEERIRNPSLPGASTVRAWRQRASNLKVRREDWDSALASVGGLDNFNEVKEVVLQKEKAHKLWQSQGAPNSRERRRLRAEHLYEGYDLDTPEDWGDSWDYYH